MKRSVAISGASSFTGLWICEYFARKNWDVHAIFSQSKNSYSGIKEHRISLLPSSVHKHFGTSAESGSMAQWILEFKPQIWVHHHHFMENFRAASYDTEAAYRVGLDPLAEIYKNLKRVAIGMIFSGSYFEPGEGQRNGWEPETPYGETKQRIWQFLEEKGRVDGFPISKVVIPNPVGPLENRDRLIPKMYEAVERGIEFEVRRPDDEQDFIPADALAAVYEQAARNQFEKKAAVFRPSGKVSRIGDFCDEVKKQLIPSVQIKKFSMAERPRMLKNRLDEAVACDWARFWKWYGDVEGTVK